MGIVNVTPDSFSDGGVHFDRQAAIESALRMEQDGATFVDVGGESTRPGADPVSEGEEVGRVVPVIAALKSEGFALPISIRWKQLRGRRALQAISSLRKLPRRAQVFGQG